MVVGTWLGVQDNGSERRGEEKRRGEPSVNHSTRVRNVVTETILLPAVFAFVAVMVLLSSWTSTYRPCKVHTINLVLRASILLSGVRLYTLSSVLIALLYVSYVTTQCTYICIHIVYNIVLRASIILRGVRLYPIRLFTWTILCFLLDYWNTN